MQARSTSGSHVCPLCDTLFRRLEHLSRHMRSHNGSKPHSCHICHKAFSRRDTLLRHLPIHDDSNNGRRSSKSGNARVSRACMQCAESRLRCDGQLPCARCRSKGNNCTYSGRSRRCIPSIEELQHLSANNHDERTNQFALYNASRRRQPSLSPSQIGGNTHNAETAVPLVENSTLLPPLIPYQSSVSSSELVVPPVIDPQQQSAHVSPDIFAPSATLPGVVPTIFDDQSTVVTPWNFNWADDSDFSIMDWITIDNSFLDPTQSHMSHCDASYSFDNARSPNDTSFITEGVHGPQQYRTQSDRSIHQVDMGNTNMGVLGPGNAEKLDLEREWPTNWDPKKADNLIYFPDMSKFPVEILEAESFAHVECLSPMAYHEITQSMKRNGLGQSPHFRSFQNANLPSIEALDCFIQLYFEYFHPIFPLLHKPSFDPRNAPWQLVLAVATLGFRYSKASYAMLGANALQELLRRSLIETIEGDNSNARELWFTQAILLDLVGMTYSGNRRLFEIAESGRNLSITQCRRKGVFRRLSSRIFNWDPRSENQSCDEDWHQWIEQESRRRLGFCAFLLDSQNELYLDGIPCISITELELQLPCSEGLWEATSSAVWKQLFLQQGNHDDSTTVHRALVQLHEKKRLLSDMSDFAQLILTHAVYRTVKSIQNMSGNMFLPNTISKQPFISNSINEACSLLQSWSTVTGTHRSTLSSSLLWHNYCVSMLLCSPRQALLRYAHHCNTTRQEQKTRDIIKNWLKEQNGCLARRAVSNAGFMLGQLRELKLHAPYTPIMIALSTITIWVYSHMAEMFISVPYSKASKSGRERGSIIRLDDGELDAQREAWIAGDVSLRAYLKDVGNICRRGASYRILDIGVQILRDQAGWGLTQSLELWLATISNRDRLQLQADAGIS